MFNVNQITSELAKMADPMLQKYASMHKDDPYTVALAVGESNRRKAMRAGAQAKMAGMQQPKVVDQDIAGMAAVDPMGNVTGALPEDMGIGKLAAPNLKRMADGGIVGYAEGGDVEHFRRGGVSDDDVFNQAFLRTLKYEGGRTNDTGGDTKYGISKKNNPDVDIDKLTIEGARRLYKERYWDAISGDKLAARDPKLAQAAFDTAVNQGVSKAKQFVTESNGDVSKLMQLRGEHYDNLVQKNPEKYGAFAKGWASRLGNLATDLAIPAAVAGETAKTGAPTAPPAAPAAPEDKRAWYDRYRDLAMSGEAQKAILHGVQDVPAALLGAPVDISYAIANKLGRNEIAGEKPFMGSQYLKEKFGQMGIRAPESTNPDLQNIREATTGITTLYNPLSEATTAGKMTKSGIDTLRKENTAAAINAARTEAETSGALGAEAKLAEEAEAARRAALSAEPSTKAAAIQKANEMAQARRAPVAKDLNPVGEAALLAGADTSIEPNPTTPAVTTPAVSPQTAPIDQEGIAQILEANKDKPTTAPSGFGGFFNDPMGILGLQLMANKNPNLLGAVGEAGQGTAKYMSDLRKAEAEQGYYGAKSAEVKALADLYNRGAKDRNMQLEAEKLVQQHMEKWATGPGKLASLQDKTAGAAEEDRVRQAIYRQLGITPATMGAQPGPSAAGWGQATVR